MKTKGKIAVVCSQGLGDGLLTLIFSQNLARNGYKVSHFNNHTAQLAKLLPDIDAISYPDHETMMKSLQEYDVVLYDSGSFFGKRVLPNDHSKIPHNFIAFQVSRTKPRRMSDYNATLAYLKRHNNGHLIDLIKCNASLKQPGKHFYPVSEHISWFMQQVLGMQNIENKPKFLFPKSWRSNKHKKRILIHPFSSSDKKNWPIDKFIELAEKLASDGWEPVFTVAPNEKQALEPKIANRFTMPVFKNIGEVAKYYYESAALIGNDSGNGHLASAMGLPVLTIFNRWKPGYSWQPQWTTAIAVAPLISRSLAGQKWKNFLSVNKVHQRFQRLTHLHQQKTEN